MMKRIALIFAVLFLLAIQASALAEVPVFFNKEPPADWQDRDLMRLIVFNSTTNDAMLLECGGESMIIDGAWQKFAGPLYRAYKKLGHVNEKGEVYVNKIFNTHPHDDHLMGIIKMLEKGLKADEFLTSFKKGYKDDIHQKALKLLKKKKIPVHYLKQNEEIQLGGAKLTVFWYKKGKEPNQLSAVARVTFGDASMLLTADLVNAAQRGILRQVPAEMLKADVMKIPHHGINICEKAFLKAVSPKFAFVTNYQREVQPVVNQMREHHITLACHNHGRIVLETDGSVWYIRQEKGQF